MAVIVHMIDSQHPNRIALELRENVLTMAHCAGSGHCGGSLSAVEILTTLYFGVMNIDPHQPEWDDRDRFVASKGHCAPALYATLAKRGFFPEDELKNLRTLGHFLQGHPDMKRVPGVDISTGSLGLGLSVGIGFALSARLRKQDYFTYVLLGDGEIQEGQVWEAAMAASAYRLNRLIAILDWNGVQLDGRVDDIMPAGDVIAKWKAFGWNVLEADGHDIDDITKALMAVRQSTDMPTLIAARTTKGKGVSFMEGNHEWHGKPLNNNDYGLAMSELRGS